MFSAVESDLQDGDFCPDCDELWNHCCCIDEECPYCGLFIEECECEGGSEMGTSKAAETCGYDMTTPWHRGYAEHHCGEPKGHIAGGHICICHREASKLPAAPSPAGETAEEDWFPYPVAAPIAPAAVSARQVELLRKAEAAIFGMSKQSLNCEHACALINQAIELAKPSSEGDGWIAVTPENLPEEGEKVIAYRNGVYALGYRSQLLEAENVYWRPLPAPPSGQGEKA